MRGQGLTKILTRRWLHANAAGAPPVLTRSEIAGRRRKAMIWGLGVGVALGSATAGGMIYREYQKKQDVIFNSADETSFLLAAKPPFKASRTVKYAGDTSGLKLTLYQYQTCPFCCKVRAMLDFFGISYNIVEVNPVLRTQLKWSEKYKKVPILIVETPEGELLQLNDSSMIVSVLYSYMVANNIKTSPSSFDGSTVHEIAKFYPPMKFMDEKGKEQSDIMNKYFLMYGESDIRSKEDLSAERKWRTWSDSVFVHTLSPNIYRTMSESVDSFKYFDRVGEWDKNFKAWERTLVIYVGAFAMWMVGKRLQKRHHLKEDVRQSLYDESNIWLENVKLTGGDFMGGAKPNLADLAVYGALNSIEGCEAFRDLNEHSRIVKDWYRKVKKSLQKPLEV